MPIECTDGSWCDASEKCDGNHIRHCTNWYKDITTSTDSHTIAFQLLECIPTQSLVRPAATNAIPRASSTLKHLNVYSSSAQCKMLSCLRHALKHSGILGLTEAWARKIKMIPKWGPEVYKQYSKTSTYHQDPVCQGSFWAP